MMLLSVGAFYFISNIISEMKKTIYIGKTTIDRVMPSTFKLTDEDSILLNPKYSNRLKVIEVLHTKSKSPITKLSYDSNYTIVIYKIPVVANQNLKEIIKFKKGNTDVSDSYSYSKAPGGIPYELDYVLYDSTKYFNILLRCTSTSPVFQVSENLVFYDVTLGRFSISYSNDSPVDILLTAHKNMGWLMKRVPVIIAFLKKNNSVFLFVFSSTNNNKPIERNLLLNLISIR